MSSSGRPPYKPSSVFTPFLRRFTDERALDLQDTEDLYYRVKEAYEATPWSKPTASNAVLSLILEPLCEAFEVEESDVPEPIYVCLDALLRQETCIFSFPEVDWSASALSLRDMVDLRRHLRAQEHFLARDGEAVGKMRMSLMDMIGAFLATFLRTQKDISTFAVPFFTTMPDLAKWVTNIIAVVSEDDHFELGLFSHLHEQLRQNLCAIAGLDPNESPPKKPYLLPADSGLPPEQMVHAYLKGTPFLALLQETVPFSIPRELYSEHGSIFAPSGHGKTQALQLLINGFLEEDDPPALFILDSHGDMLGNIQQLACFHPETGRLRDRIVIIDPEDKVPPALNFLDMGLEITAANEAAMDESFGYLMSALSSDLSINQSTAVTYLLRLMRRIDGATIHTLRDVMEDQNTDVARSPYAAVIATLDDNTQKFFRNQFFHKTAMAVTKQAVARRLYALLGNRTFETMFSAKQNRFNAARAIQEKKIVLINTSMRLLRADASAVFGRYFIAQVLAAAYERVSVPKKDRHLALLIVDEASQYFDDHTETILAETRKFNVALLFATQHVDQMPPNVRTSMANNTSIKMAGPVASSDAKALAPDMYTTPEFIRSMRKDRDGADFACYLRGKTPAAVKLTVPFRRMEDAPKMDDLALARLRIANRLAVGPLETETHEAPTNGASRVEKGPPVNDADDPPSIPPAGGPSKNPKW